MNEPYTRTLLALTAWRESRNQPWDGIRGVMHVIRNRALRLNNYITVITAKNQFSSITVLGDSQTVLWPAEDDALFARIFDFTLSILDGSDPDPTFGAQFYANLEIADSPWFRKNIIQQPGIHPQTCKIGNHTFFK